MLQTLTPLRKSRPRDLLRAEESKSIPPKQGTHMQKCRQGNTFMTYKQNKITLCKQTVQAMQTHSRPSTVRKRDLRGQAEGFPVLEHILLLPQGVEEVEGANEERVPPELAEGVQIGRASCRERV